MKRFIAALCLLALFMGGLPAFSEGGVENARDALIEGVIAEAEKIFTAANGKAKRAQYAGDIYVCKNFTTHVFKLASEGYEMAAHPGVVLSVPANLPREDCKPYVYGLAWRDVPASEGNPFEVAAAFRYDAALSKQENRELARTFLANARRGDFFQMAANYYYGVGAHSLIFTDDYDAQTDKVRWTDSNMKGKKVNGERYGYVQFGAEKDIDWFVDAFCRKNYGATLYRLRDDIVKP